MDFSGQGGPGPGEYNPYSKDELVIENLNASSPTKEGTRSFNSKLPRYHEVVVKEEEKKVMFTLCYIFCIYCVFFFFNLKTYLIKYIFKLA